MKMNKVMLVVGFAVLIVALVLLGPWLVIWAMNTLFPVLAISYTWQTWLAVLIMSAFFQTKVSVKK
jgi:hypothetical protein